MAWWGKMIGGTLGFMLGGHLGALFGIALGHQHDQAGRRPGIGASGTEQTQAAFLPPPLPLWGILPRPMAGCHRRRLQWRGRSYDKCA